MVTPNYMKHSSAKDTIKSMSLNIATGIAGNIKAPDKMPVIGII